jgi:ribosomal protein L29
MDFIELKNKNEKELRVLLKEQLRLLHEESIKVTNQESKQVHKIKLFKKTIARLRTLLNNRKTAITVQ